MMRQETFRLEKTREEVAADVLWWAGRWTEGSLVRLDADEFLWCETADVKARDQRGDVKIEIPVFSGLSGIRRQPLGSNAISLDIKQVYEEEIQITAKCVKGAEPLFERLLEMWPDRMPVSEAVAKEWRGGRPPLWPERIAGLATAQRADRIRTEAHSKGDDMTWKEAAQEAEWEDGWDKAGLEKLARFVKKLEQLELDDPDGLLEQVKRHG